MAYLSSWPFRVWEPDSENWKQILSRDEYQIPDTTKKIIRGHCERIEAIFTVDLIFGGRYIYTVEEKQKEKKLHNDYADLGQRVVNEAGNTDWNGVEEMLEGISNEMLEIKNGAQERWKEKAEHMRIGAVEELRKCLAELNRMEAEEPSIAAALFEQSICVEDMFGNKVEVESVKRSDPVEKLLDKIEIKTKIPKHEIVLTCNGERLERNHRLTDYDVNGLSSIIMLRDKQQGLKKTSTSFDLRKFVMDKFNQLYGKIGALVSKFPQFFQDTTRMLTGKDFSRISQVIGDGWQLLGAELGLDIIKLQHIKADNNTVELKVFDMMVQWSRKNPNEATTGSLYTAIKNCSKLSCDLEQLRSILFGI